MRVDKQKLVLCMVLIFKETLYPHGIQIVIPAVSKLMLSLPCHKLHVKIKKPTANIQGTHLIFSCGTAERIFFPLVLKKYTTLLWFSIWPLKYIPGGDTTWEHCWYHEHRVLRARPNPFHFQKLDKAFQLLIWLHSHDRCPEIKRPAQHYFNLKGKCKTQMVSKVQH